ncbi:MAG: hypothetical protein R2684_08405 [Pyrinomonadaceae bacterium]
MEIKEKKTEKIERESFGILALLKRSGHLAEVILSIQRKKTDGARIAGKAKPKRHDRRFRQRETKLRNEPHPLKGHKTRAHRPQIFVLKRLSL